MRLLRRLFARTPVPSNGPQSSAPPVTSGQGKSEPVDLRRDLHTFADHQIRIQYTRADGAKVRRTICFLVASPGGLLTGIDLDKRRVRTFRLDRISNATDENGVEIGDILSHIAARSAVLSADLEESNPDRAVALAMRKDMLPALSLLVLMASTNGPMSPLAHEAIMKYAARDNRFAVREGWVPAGDKRRVWPILADLVLQLQPKRGDIDAYVKSLNEEWDNARRFEVLNEALAAIGQIDGSVTKAKLELANAINSHAASSLGGAG